MYEKFFGFSELPFRQTPDPQFFYSSPTHEDALNLILHGITHREGFMVITGEVGTGKTTVCRRLVEALDPGVKAAVIPNPGLTTIELLQTVNQEFGLTYTASSKKELGDELSRFLLDNLKAGGSAVLIIDEAQNLSVECLEEIRLLSNLETTKEKLLQIVLVGQPELEDKLRMNELRQLTQRIALHNHLRPLSLDETRRYVSSRLEVAGWRDRVLFTSGAVDRLYALSQGLPRLINFLCDKALQAACTKETRMIGEAMVDEAGRKRPGASWPVHQATPGPKDLSPSQPLLPLSPSSPIVDHRHRPRLRVTPVWVGLVCFIVVGVAGALYWLAPTWQKVNENLTGAGKVPPSLTVNPGLADPDRVEESVGPSSAGRPESEPSIVLPQTLPQPPSAVLSPVQEPMPAPQPKTSQEAVPPGGGDKVLTMDTVSAFTPVGAQDARLAATVFLLQRWGRLQSTPLKAFAGRDPSGLIRESGFQSSTVKVELGLLERLDYPCLVEWMNKPGEETHPVVLVGLGPQEVTILDPLVGRRVLDRTQFLRLVRGEALILWKGLPGIKVPLRPKKDKDPVVVELQRVLEKQGLFEGGVNGVYNTKTRAAVSRLQSDFGLKQTGLFGAQSYMALAKLVLGPEVPSLKAPANTPKKEAP